MKLLIFGGFDKVAHILRTRGYNARRLIFDEFVHWLYGSPYPSEAAVFQSQQDNRSRRAVRTKALKESNISEHIAMHEEQQTASHLPKINCATYPRLSQDNIVRVSEDLPHLQDIFVKAAERIILQKNPKFSEPHDLPSLMKFTEWAFTSGVSTRQLEGDEDSGDTADYTSVLNDQDVDFDGDSI